MRKLISSIFMVTGTTIGGGMIVLPAVIGVYSYYSAISILIAIWFVNTIIALVFLEASCYLPAETNLISLSRRLLGRVGEWGAWLVSLVFLYTIMCIYTTGMTEIISGFLESYSFSITPTYISIFSILSICLPLYLGMRQLDLFKPVYCY